MNGTPHVAVFRRIVPLLLPIIVAAVVGGFVSVYMARWLEDDIELSYRQMDDLVAQVGLSQLQEGLTAYIERLQYGTSSYTSLRAVRYLLQNEAAQSLDEPSTFYFIARKDGQTIAIAPDAVVDVRWTPLSQESDGPLLKRTDDSVIGPGFTMVSAFPGKSLIQVTLVLDVDAHPDLAEAQIGMRKKAGQATLTEKTSFPRTYNLSLATLLIVVLVASAVGGTIWASLWMIVNIYQGNYTVGARIIDNILYVLFGIEYFPSRKPRTDLTRASVREIERLPGVGLDLARAIVDYREQAGGFSTAGALLAVPGMDEAVLARLQHWITVN